MNYAVFENLCKEKGTTPTALSIKLGLSKGNTTSWKKGGNPSVEVLLQLSDELNCTTDYLLTGKNPAAPINCIDSDLTEQEQRALNALRKLSANDRIEFIARMEQKYEDYTSDYKKELAEHKSEETA